MLTPRKAAFIAAYVVEPNATQAAIKAGYSEATAGQQGSRLLKDVDIQQALLQTQTTAEQRVATKQDEAIGSAAWIIEKAGEVVRLALECDSYGNPRNISAATPALALLAKRLPEFSDKHEIEAKVGVLLIRKTRGLRK